MKMLSRALEFFAVSFLALLLAVPQQALAQNHVVSSSDLQKDLTATSVSRHENVTHLEEAFSSPQAQRALKSAHVTYQQVDNAIQQLSNDDLARLAARSDKAQQDFTAGRISDRALIIILVAIVALILIIVAVR